MSRAERKAAREWRRQWKPNLPWVCPVCRGELDAQWPKHIGPLTNAITLHAQRCGLNSVELPNGKEVRW